MAMSGYNERLELAAKQITGDVQESAGVYARLLVDANSVSKFDLRYFWRDEKKKRMRSTMRGMIFSKLQVQVLIAALTALLETAEAKGLS